MSTTERLTDDGRDDSEITLGILNAVHENERITQRSVAKDLGIALGLTNAYLKRCIKKGLIKVSQAPANRYAYYLTPKGFSEKSRLTAEYLSDSFRFFRNARHQCEEAVSQAAERGWRTLALYGNSELADIASLCATADVEIIGIVDPDGRGPGNAPLPIVPRLTDLPRVDAVIVTSLSEPQAVFEALHRDMPAERIFTPPLLRVARSAALAGSEPRVTP